MTQLDSLHSIVGRILLDDWDPIGVRDGSIFGLRLSRDSGLTLDILRSNDPAIPNAFRIHQR